MTIGEYEIDVMVKLFTRCCSFIAGVDRTDSFIAKAFGADIVIPRPGSYHQPDGKEVVLRSTY